MNQQALEDAGVGFRCRGCGITVFTSVMEPKFCTSCRKDKPLMTNRTTIYLGEPLKRLLDAAGRENRSGRINCMAECYNTIIQDELLHLDLSPSEWCAICDANNPGWGVFSLGDAWTSANFAWANVADTPGIGAKWEIDDKALVEKMRAMRPAARIAVYEVVSRFWDHPRLNELTHDELLREAGAIFADSIIRKQLANSLRMEAGQ